MPGAVMEGMRGQREEVRAGRGQKQVVQGLGGWRILAFIPREVGALEGGGFLSQVLISAL